MDAYLSDEHHLSKREAERLEHQRLDIELRQKFIRGYVTKPETPPQYVDEQA